MSIQGTSDSRPGPNDPIKRGYRRPLEGVVNDVKGANSLEEAIMVALGGADGRKFDEVEQICNALIEYGREHYVMSNSGQNKPCTSVDSESPSDLAHGPEV